MDKVERARKLYEFLEGKRNKVLPVEVAQRNFCIQELLVETVD